MILSLALDLRRVRGAVAGYLKRDRRAIRFRYGWFAVADFDCGPLKWEQYAVVWATAKYPACEAERVFSRLTGGLKR